MPIYKHYAKDYYYHVYSRGNQKQPIFKDNDDYHRFIKKMAEYKEKYKVDILTYCLMPNHFHFLLLQKTNLPITKFIQALLVSHVRYFQTKYGLSGHLFQERFRAKIIDSQESLLQLLRYTLQSPSQASGNYSDSFLNSYQWFSYADYLANDPNTLTETETLLNYFSQTNSSLSFKEFIKAPIEKDREKLIKNLIY